MRKIIAVGARRHRDGRRFYGYVKREKNRERAWTFVHRRDQASTPSEMVATEEAARKEQPGS